MRRVVIDPGVLVSAATTPGGSPAELVRAVREGQLALIVSPHLLAELLGVLARRKFRGYRTGQVRRRCGRSVMTGMVGRTDPLRG